MERFEITDQRTGVATTVYPTEGDKRRGGRGGRKAFPDGLSLSDLWLYQAHEAAKSNEAAGRPAVLDADAFDDPDGRAEHLKIEIQNGEPDDTSAEGEDAATPAE